MSTPAPTLMQKDTISHKTTVSIDKIVVNLGNLYGSGTPLVPAPAGTELSNLALGAVSMNVKFVNKGSWIDNSAVVHNFNAGDYAFTVDTLTSLGATLFTPSVGEPVRGVWCTLYTDQIQAVSSIVEGVPGALPANNGIDYQMTVEHHKIVSNVLISRKIAAYYFTIFKPKV